MTGILQMIGHPYHFNSSGNNYLDHFGRYLPSALIVNDQTALDGYYQGHNSLYRPENYGPWLRPVALWSGFVLALFWTNAMYQCSRPSGLAGAGTAAIPCRRDPHSDDRPDSGAMARSSILDRLWLVARLPKY